MVNTLKRVILYLVTIAIVVTGCPNNAWAYTEQDEVGYINGPERVPFVGNEWMDNLYGNMKLGSMTIPWSHDSGTFNIKFTKSDSLYKLLLEKMNKEFQDVAKNKLGTIGYAILSLIMIKNEAIIKVLAETVCEDIQRVSGQCQNLSIRQQLEAGVRGIDLRYRYDKGCFNIYHGDAKGGLEGVVQVCECYDENNNRLTLDKCFSDIADFVSSHPTEFVLVKVQNEGGEESEEVYRALDALERKYGIKSDLKNRSDDAGLMTYRELKGHIFDVSNAISDTTQASWNATVAQKKGILKSAIENPNYSDCYLKKAEGNIAVKIWKAHDPNNECDNPLKIKWISAGWIRAYLFWLNIPLVYGIDMGRCIKSPHDQSVEINKFIISLLQEYERMADAGDVSYSAPGLIGMDFVNAKMCCSVASVNGVRELMVPRFYLNGNDDFDETLWDEYDEIIEVDEEAYVKEICDAYLEENPEENPEEDPVIYEEDPEIDPVIYEEDPEEDPVIYEEDPETDPVIYEEDSETSILNEILIVK